MCYIKIQENLADKILDIIAHSGDFPAGELYRLQGNLRHIRQTVRNLIGQKMLLTFRKNGLHSFRLTSKAKKYLLAINPIRYEFFIARSVGTNYISSDISKRLRLHAMTEIWMLMRRCGVITHRDIKPAIFENPNTGDTGRIPTATVPTFYSSREIKEIPGEAAKIKNSRSVGLLLTKTDVFLLYHTGVSVLKWYPRSETKLIAVCNYLFSIKGEYDKGAIKGIIIGDDMEIATKLLDSDGGYKRQFFRVDHTFEHLHFIPNNEDGLLILKLLMNRDLDESMKAVLTENILPQNNDFNIENDAITKDGTPVLFAYDFDLVRINRFAEGLCFKDIRGIIYCFDFQEKAITEFFAGAKAEIIVIISEKVKTEFEL